MRACGPCSGYAAVSVAGGLGMLGLALGVFRSRTGEPAMRVAQHLFGFSILYLFALFATLLAEVVYRALAPMVGGA